MRVAKLSPELVALIHHVELNKAGWWDRAVQRLIVAAVWLAGEGLTPQAVSDRLREAFGVNLAASTVEKQLQVLCDSNTLVALHDGRFKIAEGSLKGFEASVAEAEAIAQRAEEKFVELLRRCCPSLNAAETWTAFRDELLVPLIHEMGARTYELVSGSRMELDEKARFQEFLERYPPELRDPLRHAVIDFMDPSDADVRACILRELNAYFFLEAGNLGEETVHALTTVPGRTPSFVLFVDTNVLFSILQLHENPSNEAAQALMAVIQRLGGKVSVKLYVSPITVDETRRVLEFCERDLAELGLSPNLSDVALASGLHGFAQKFAQESRRATGRLAAKDYFRPYLTDLIHILRDKGVELHNQKIDGYRTKQEVIDDLNEQLEFEKRRPGVRPKGYETLLHDMVLWHFAADQRPLEIESPLDAVFWVVTVDYRLLGFDAYKRAQGAITTPVCLHPATLMQLLQFWIPRTPEFEKAVVGTLRLPFLFQEFDPAAERVTIRILQALSRFENVGDLSTETIHAIVVNEALRQKLAVEQDREAQITLVREALIEEHQRTADELQAAKARIAGLPQEAAESAKTADGARRLATQERQAAEEVERRLAEEREARKSVEDRLARLEAQLEDKETQHSRNRQIRSFVVRWAVIPLGSLSLAVFVFSFLVASATNWGPWRPALAAASGLLIVWAWLADVRGSGDPLVNGWRPFALFCRVRNRLFGALGLILLAIVANAIYDWVRFA